MSRPLVIVGAGGFGREVFAIVQAINARGGDWLLEGFVDDAPSYANAAAVAKLGSRILGGVRSVIQSESKPWVVVAVGAPQARRKIVASLEASPPRWATLVHPDATLGPDVDVAEGTVVAPGARLSTGIRVGRHVHVDQNVTVGHDSDIGDYARLNPQACISGSVSLGPACLVGASAAVLQGLYIGDGATVGAGAVVTRDVPSDSVVKGVPAC